MWVSADALFARSWRVLVQYTEDKAVDVSGLDIEFKVLRTLKPTPNRATVVVWNLSPTLRAALLKRNRPQGATGKEVPVFVQVEAGYQGKNLTLLYADMRQVTHIRQGTDWKTTISMDDGGAAVRAARFPNNGMCFLQGTPIQQVLLQACNAMGIGLGNAAQFSTNADIFGWDKVLPHTMTLHGSAFDGLKRVVASIGATFSIQNGVLQLLPKGRAWAADAILLTPDTGLLDSPEAAQDATVSLGFAKAAKGKPSTPNPPSPKNTAILKATVMLIPGLVPGRLVRLETGVYNDTYEISEVEYVGQSWGKDWKAVMVLRSYVTT